MKYRGPCIRRQPKDLPSAYEFPNELQASLDKEVKLGRMLGPFSSEPIPNLICSPVRMVPKKGLILYILAK